MDEAKAVWRTGGRPIYCAACPVQQLPRPLEGERVFAGLSACPGFGHGGSTSSRGEEPDGEVNPPQIRPDVASAPVGAVIASEDLTPAEMLRLDAAEARRDRALARLGHRPCRRDGASSGTAVAGRPRDDLAALGLAPDDEALVDAVAGELTLAAPRPGGPPSCRGARYGRADRARDELALPRPAATADGTPILVSLAVDELSQLRTLNPAHTDGVGLVRTEMLFMNRSAMPGEEAQLALYRVLLQWADGRPVCMRTVDPGAGKTLPGMETLRPCAASPSRSPIPTFWAFSCAPCCGPPPMATCRSCSRWSSGPSSCARSGAAIAGCVDELRREGRPFGTPPAGHDGGDAGGGGAHRRVRCGRLLDRAWRPYGPDARARPRRRRRRSVPDAPARRARLVGASWSTRRGWAGPAASAASTRRTPALLPGWLDLGAREFCVPAAELGRVKSALAAIDLRSRPARA